MPDESPLDRVRELRELQADLPRQIREAGRAARESGHTWVEIAEAGSWPDADAAQHDIRDATAARRAARAADARARRTRVTDDLPGVGVAAAAKTLGITREKVYGRIARGELNEEVHHTPAGRPMRRIVAGLPGQPPAHSDTTG